MDKSEILAAIKKKVYYAELPSKMHVSVMDDTLHLIIDADGVLQNMQKDASAFEGWVFCIKSFIPTITDVVIDWDNKYTELDAKSIDCIWNGMTITDEGKLNASITDPYVHNAQVVVMAKDKLAQYPDAASMKDLKFAVENGSAGAEVAAEEGFENVTPVLDQSTALMEVSSGSADACIIDITMANSMTGEGTSYANYGYQVQLREEEYGIACRKGSDLVAEINKITDELMADGTMDQIAEKYQLTLIK